MMQKLGSDRIEEQGSQVSITFGGKDFGRQVTQHPVDANRAVTDAEIQNRLSGSLQQDQGEVGRNVATHVGQGQRHEVHSGLIETEQQVNQGWLGFNRFAEPGLNPPERLEQEPWPGPFANCRAGDWFGHG
jgi:hypothetical protein